MNLVVIPARYGSTRFPGKALAKLHGKPLVEWVWQHCREAEKVGRVLVATDHEEIATVVKAFGGEVVMTSPDHPSGTDRVAEACEGIKAEWIINVQGDEPMLRGRDLDAFISRLNSSFGMATMARRIDRAEDVQNPNVVKVVTDLEGRALYFSRAPIPFRRDSGSGESDYWHHLGIYAYKPEVLKKIVHLPPGSLEITEKLEQLRALQNGIAIQVIPTSLVSVGVDTLMDLTRVEGMLEQALSTHD